ncbi:MAG: flagellar filament capping protein FliD [Novosphingobium sp.]|nr:flagellar filament capping protein FliD [Novosphingobium sp.]
MTTTSATSSIISKLGAGSGIDMAGLATSLAEAQFATRIDRNSVRSETVERQISAASTLKSQLLQLVSGIADRVRTGDMAAQPSVANPAVASASKGILTGSGTYTLEVSALAKAQTLTSPAYANAAAPTGSGTLTLRFGTVGAGSFSEDPAHAAATITVPSGATLSQVAAAINSAASGVTAYVASGADGAHLMLKGKDGAASGFVLEASETPGEPGLAALAWSPAAAPERLLAGAANAAFKLDGLAMTSATNTLNDIAPGLNLIVTGTNPGAPTTIRFSDPGANVSGFMTDLTAALNELVAGLNQDIAPQGGDLARDPGARALRKALSQLAGSSVMPGAAPGDPATLADLGLATNRDGTFRLDATRLSATLKAAPTGVAAMFTNGIHGVLATFDKLGRSATSAGDPGSLSGSLARYAAQKLTLSNEKLTLAEAQDTLRARLASRFAGVDARVGASRSTLTFLQNQIDAWNAQKN